MKGIGGNGLGLWVSKEIVDRHHGTVRVRSSTKEGSSGTVFILCLLFEAMVYKWRGVLGCAFEAVTPDITHCAERYYVYAGYAD